MGSSADLRDGFFQECDELLEALTDGLAAIEAGTDSSETVNAVFRAVHSIKGGAGAFALEGLVAFAHTFESVLDDLRAGSLELTPSIIGQFYNATDRLYDLVDAARHGTDSAPEFSDPLMKSLQALCSEPASVGRNVNEQEEAFVPLGILIDIPIESPADVPPLSRFEILFFPFKDLYANGNDAALLIRALSSLGSLDVTADLDRIRPLSEMEWDDPCIGWRLHLETSEDEVSIREVFDFVDGQCRLEIGALPDAVQSDHPRPNKPAINANDSQPPEPKVEELEELAPQKPPAPSKTTIRVDLDRIDRLINIVGEMVISEAMLAQSVQELSLSPGSQIEAAMAQLKQLSSELQESVMAIRAQPVKPLFQRMSRIVREATQATGKDARIVTIGDNVEVDKTVIERLVDPLTHMIRNAIDHGIEDTNTRTSAGKSDQGTITLSAAHRSGRVVIELSDDGGGIDRQRVRETAISKGLVSENVELSDVEIDNILFMPGFSTSRNISNLSGRGVGMDVVKSEIRALGGRVNLHSTPGQGTTVSISLPLTLAVMEGMIVMVAGETLVIPTSALRETMRADEAGVQFLGVNEMVMSTGDELVSVIDLGASLGYRSVPERFTDHTLLLIENENGRRTAVAVDQVCDQREVVIKGLEANYGYIPGVSAATILGDGRIALIIDTDQLQVNQISSVPNSGTGPTGVSQYG